MAFWPKVNAKRVRKDSQIWTREGAGEAGHRKVKSAGDNALAVNRNLWRARQFNACDFR